MKPNRLISFLTLTIGLATAFSQGAEISLGGHQFTLPDGFTMELIAAPPLTERPITGGFDELGRLYVGESSGTNDNVQKQLAERPHRILRLEDSDGDGRFDHRTVFADKMMFPEGTMWHDGSLYVAAPPSIWKLTDTDDDGVADRREEWFQGKTLTGCANDLHGPYLGPDGWIYWCKGAFAEQTYERPGRKALVTKAAHIFRCRTGGSGLEPVMTGGMDNPVDVVFTPGGERIFTTTFLQNPGGGLRDGLIHAIYGGVYGKVQGVIDSHPQTGGLMPPLAHLGAAAPCGLTTYESRSFGEGFQNNLFAALFNMHKITRHVLEPDGGSFKSRDEDFLVAESLDFHPTDVLEDADGSLVVVNTGGWYKLCCPTSQLHKPDVLGAIYRVRRIAAPRIDDPRGQQVKWNSQSVDDTAKLLNDPRPAVRQRAIGELARRGKEAIPALALVVKQSPAAEARRNAIWTLIRIENQDSAAIVRSGLTDADESVRQAALHAISLTRDREALLRLVEMLRDEKLSPHNRRLAAETIGRIGDNSAVTALLSAAGKPHDRPLEHALIFALIEIQDPKGTAHGLLSDSVWTKRAVLIALSEMEGDVLKPQLVAPLLASPDSVLKDTASWIISRHVNWGNELAGFLLQRLMDESLTENDQKELEQQLSRFGSANAIQRLLAESANRSSLSAQRRALALRAMARSGLKAMPEIWTEALVHTLSQSDPTLYAQAIATIRAIPPGKQRPAAMIQALLQIAQDEKSEPSLRVQAAAAVPGGLSDVSPELFALLRAQLGGEVDVGLRSAAVDVLTTARLSPKQLGELAADFDTVGPLEANRLLAAFEPSGDEAAAQQLVDTLKKSPATAGMRIDAIQKALEKSPRSVRQSAIEIYTRLNADIQQQKVQLEQLLGTLKGGDARRGQAVFHSKKTACFACHAIGYLGGNIGLDLTRIGGIRSERDLLESVIFPSASFVRSYESVVVLTTDGLTYSGLVRQDLPTELVVALAADKLVRISKADIQSIAPGQVSVMPAGLDKQLTPQELADLLEFLKGAK
ncbi:MAG: PVC-type heme-binding CxxCH protein [Pirellulaceae bacterium]